MIVAIPAPAARDASAASRSGGVMKTPRSVPAGSGLAGLRFDRLEEGRRPRRERPVGEELLPAQPRPIEARRERITAPEARFDRRVDLLLADAGVDAKRQAAGGREAPVGLDPAAEPLLHRQRTRVMDRHDAELDEPLGERGDEPVVALLSWAGEVIRYEPGRRFVEDPGRIATVVAPDEAAGLDRRCRARPRPS